MKVVRIEVSNFRLLKSFSLDLESNLSLVLGKNNSGKTSLLSALEKFINSSERHKIVFDDFNVDLKAALIKLVGGGDPIGSESTYLPLGITLKLYIEYDDADNLSAVSQLIMSLDPDDNHIVLGFEYLISYSQLTSMRNDYSAVKDKYDNDPSLFLKENQHIYFDQVRKKSFSYSDPKVFTDLTKENISLADVVSFRSIGAKRSVTNKDNDKTLSSQTAIIYKKTSENQEQQEAVEGFKKQLRSTDIELSEIYQDMFSGLLSKVAKFGGSRLSETHIKIASTLQHRELLDGNTTVMYTHDTHDLPEHFNGLGYMNLISMIFEIEMLMSSFRRPSKENPYPLHEPHIQSQLLIRNAVLPILFWSRQLMMRPDAKVEKVYLYPKPVDFRKSIDGLAALVELDIKVAVFDPVLFVFLNRHRNRVKILYWERNGFCLWLKRLESERFKTSPEASDKVIVLSVQELNWLLDGFDLWRNRPHQVLTPRFVA